MSIHSYHSRHFAFSELGPEVFDFAVPGLKMRTGSFFIIELAWTLTRSLNLEKYVSSNKSR